ncbi:SDR family NAD(P)-dependent oxidoreductase [Subtercola lobariae]|uniref:Short-chain dehydrogenase n=1 Tax=Subtercola lobariae TaxID=1588641 RepID=A0A917B9J8_9MICO|nr:SDR family NAD(P)-dependent oxidoreductase [Subtercola lobariae]GGF28968.1 short-chain dehydrogenase [Subtercola lobariae]
MTTSPHTASAELAGTTALVTGATSGIGRATALALAAAGAEVLVHGRDADRGAAVVSEIESIGGHARFLAADISNPQGAHQLAAEAGRVDILVNNAGFSWFGPSEDLDDSTLASLFASNVESAYILTAALAPAMVDRGFGSVVNLSSMAASVGLAGGAAYSATKGAMVALTKSWAAEYSPAGVRVNAVAPGPIYTGGAASDRIAALGQTTIMGRAAQPEDVANMIEFLVSPRAQYVTGAVFAVDGGRTAI